MMQKTKDFLLRVAVLAVLVIMPSSAMRGAEADILPTLRPLVVQVTKEFSEIPAERQEGLKEIALYIKSKNAANEPVQLTFICTHNSRRSHLAAVWAATAAEYYGVPGVKIFSGGIEVTACNIRTVRAMRRAGFSVVDSTGGTNPVYLVQYSEKAAPMRAFSKLYNQEGNPRQNYLAAMTCAHADASCPLVAGASRRVGIHYDDPKESDGKPEEEATYDERCRQIAREMFFALSLVKN
jgi:arsenate reductase